MCADKEMVAKTFCCQTKCVVQKYEFNWTIENFPLLRIMNEHKRDSLKFPGEESDISFSLRLLERNYILVIEILPSVREETNVKNYNYGVSVNIPSNDDWKYNSSNILPNICVIRTNINCDTLVEKGYYGNCLI